MKIICYEAKCVNDLISRLLSACGISALPSVINQYLRRVTVAPYISLSRL